MSKPRRANTGPTQRQLRAGEVVRHALVDILARGELHDPDLQGVSVTVSEVRPSQDLRQATVFVAPLGPGDAKKTAEALNRCSKYLRGQLGRQIELKFTPELLFQPDDSFDKADHISVLLHHPDVARDLRRDDDEDDVDGAGEPRD